MRLNMAHATKQWVADTIWHIREVSAEVGRQVAILMDVKGPEIRTGLIDTPLKLHVGETWGSRLITTVYLWCKPNW